MYIKNSILENYGNFELDTEAISLRSVSDTDIKLPYTGILPEQMSKASNAYIYFNVQLAQNVRLVLIADCGEKKIKRPLRASNAEIISILDKFFAQPRGYTGMYSDDKPGPAYWLGLWHAHYIEWRKVTTVPSRLFAIISRLSIKDKKLLKEHIMDVVPEC